MIILPAIDIKDGNCVRLLKGDFNTAQKVAENSLITAMNFQNDGASWLHTVDLDGAKAGKPINQEIFVDIAKNTKLKVEVGGGIRCMKSVEFYINNGIERVILGSASIKDPDFVKQAVKEYGEHIAVGIDALNQMVAAEGWLEKSNIHYIDLAKTMESIGVQTIIYTDISKDGMLGGVNLSELKEINDSVSCNIIASGGVKNLDDIYNLKHLDMYGCICGKALYQGTLKLAEALKVGERC